jgi:succinate-semialdehyde dehydrogenase/glutarate-semialdehyde dehydrogenase
MPFPSIDPTTGETWRSIAETSADEIERTLARAARARQPWSTASVAERAAALAVIARELRSRAHDDAIVMAREMGKPVRDGAAEIEKCATACDYYAEHAERLLAPEPRDVGGARAYVRFDPLGAVLAIMPWNYPFWQVVRCAVPALAAGNTIVLKHAENVPACADALAQIVAAAGLPEGVFEVLHVSRERMEPVVRDPRIHGVALTGSTAAGRAVARAAGESLKKTVLELGGSDAFLVLDDADLELAARVAADARLVNAGQSCIAAKRFIVLDAIAVGFVERLVAAMRERRQGNPLDPATELGPLARRDLRDGLHRQVEASVARGARRVLGGTVPSGPGAFYPPTVLLDVTPGMPAFDEETFGPVAAVVRARDEDDAVALANASPYGLGASVCSRDAARAERIAARLEAGTICVNGQVRSDPRLPFGGVKQSGYGRELSEYGLREFVNVKSVVLR